ncbi:hypothetical protein JQT66_04410 [Sulfitobacter mediterraneus]|uniref:hypothetical protein n=1 Tax=Sulfitobacter mediterraneus TaxID=83219 RepID=UPI001932DFEC|nr:hypothetical protein [Sulfitobacter mediterraneus]MBM1309076.1 hypothetical protein [Sulfitobacter mediterraneus]MBM1312960.1 hypothetical protein [Sulfitobacter mediterraneus]MBM1321344.1 hypothetical protein [Sulfitobacter mediterraneus]MBM1325231.1 hypothetical protein [Sulfitobacter mediterraneus]MBM1396578.1 hypothetical protein [Sulfitobacter mediterraneus]
MSDIINLPTAAPSYYTVHKSGPLFSVFLITPCGSQKLKTRLCDFRDRDSAIEFGREVAATQKRPFKIRGVAV